MRADTDRFEEGFWSGGDLTAMFEKNGRTLRRRLSPDRHWTARDGSPLSLHGRSLLLVRNVGLLMTTPAVRLTDGAETPEGILDAIVTSVRTSTRQPHSDNRRAICWSGFSPGAIPANCSGV